MKAIVVTTIKGQTESISAFPSKKAAEKELREVWGWQKRNLSTTTYSGCLVNQFGMPQNAIAVVFSAKEWETMQYAY